MSILILKNRMNSPAIYTIDQKYLHGAQGTLSLMSAPAYSDLAILHDTYNCHTLVTLMTSGEMDFLKVSQLGEQCHEIGMDWIWCPIINLGAPKEITAFDECVEKIVARVREGENVVIHCAHGKGRAGAISAGCLMKLGCAPKIAVKVIRKTRPGALPTEKQKKFIQKYWGYC